MYNLIMDEGGEFIVKTEAFEGEQKFRKLQDHIERGYEYIFDKYPNLDEEKKQLAVDILAASGVTPNVATNTERILTYLANSDLSNNHHPIHYSRDALTKENKDLFNLIYEVSNEIHSKVPALKNKKNLGENVETENRESMLNIIDSLSKGVMDQL